MHELPHNSLNASGSVIIKLPKAKDPLPEDWIPLQSLDQRFPPGFYARPKMAERISKRITNGYFRAIRMLQFLPRKNDHIRIEFNILEQTIDLYPFRLDEPGVTLDRHTEMTIEAFHSIVYGGAWLSVGETVQARLTETRDFIDYLLDQFQKASPENKKQFEAYGINTGFADLRDKPISPEQAGTLSTNIIRSHDAGIGDALPLDVVLGAMVLRANTLAKGYSGFQLHNLQTLVDMINHRIIPVVPRYGSLGASGDLAYLARIGGAMLGDADVEVWYSGHVMSAGEALEKAGISPMVPGAKEGLALTNGTPFMASMITIAYLNMLQHWENTLADQVLFLNCIQAIDAAFYDCIHDVRQQEGQSVIARFLYAHIKDSPLINRTGIQNDYSIRCIPQILGPKIDEFRQKKREIEAELNAVTDNPLIFKEGEFGDYVTPSRKIRFRDQDWIVVSGGNFYGGYSAHPADVFSFCNAEMVNMAERQHTYLLNPKRNAKTLNSYLVANEAEVGLKSGHMIVQYTHNALVTQMTYLASPISTLKIDSGNHCEDIVSQGALAGIKLLEQLELIGHQNTLKFVSAMQAYSIARAHCPDVQANAALTSEQLYAYAIKSTGLTFPYTEDRNFSERYARIEASTRTMGYRAIIGYPLMHYIGFTCCNRE